MLVSDLDLNNANHVLGIQHQIIYHKIDLCNLLNCYIHLNETTILYVLFMSRTRFRVNPHSMDA